MEGLPSKNNNRTLSAETWRVKGKERQDKDELQEEEWGEEEQKEEEEERK